MATTTTPDNLPAPSLTDPYAVTQDFLNLADATQAALNRRGNAYRGTSTERTAFTSASIGTLWKDTDGIKMLWQRESSSWVPAVWRWGGTTAQRTAFTQAPAGFEWYDTTLNATFLRSGTTWIPSADANVFRHLSFQTQTSGSLAASWTDVPGLSFTYTNTRTSKFRLTLDGRGVNGTSGAYRTFGIRFMVDNVAPFAPTALITIDYPSAGAWASAISEKWVTPALSPGTHTFKVQGFASLASAVVPNFYFEVEEAYV